MENRQNRTLVVIIAVILAFASVLICLTLMQDRRETPQPHSPADSTSKKSESDVSLNTEADSTPVSTSPKQDTPSNEPETTDASAQVPDDEAVIADDSIPNFISPVAGVLSQTHNTEVPVYSLTMNDYRTHAGVDIVAVSGAEPEYFNFIGAHDLQPVVNVLPDANEVYKTLEKLILQRERIPQMCHDSRLFVEQHHDCRKVAQQFVDFWSR